MTTRTNQFPDSGDLLHRVWQPVRRPGRNTSPTRFQVARPQPDHRLARAMGRKPSFNGNMALERPAARHPWAAAAPLQPQASPGWAPATPLPRNAEYYTLGHLARFVAAGGECASPSTSFGPRVGKGRSWDVAFRNQDGSIVMAAQRERQTRARRRAEGGQPSATRCPGGPWPP